MSSPPVGFTSTAAPSCNHAFQSRVIGVGVDDVNHDFRLRSTVPTDERRLASLIRAPFPLRRGSITVTRL